MFNDLNNAAVNIYLLNVTVNSFRIYGTRKWTVWLIIKIIFYIFIKYDKSYVNNK